MNIENISENDNTTSIPLPDLDILDSNLTLNQVLNHPEVEKERSPRKKSCAIRKVFNGKNGMKKLSLSSISAITKVSPSTIKRSEKKLNEDVSLNNRDNQHVLNENEEVEIIEWIKSQINVNNCPSKNEIAEEIRKRSIERCRNGIGCMITVSEGYVRKLLKKNNILLKRPLTNYEEKARPTKKDAKILYRNIHYVINKRKIKTSLIFNMDESWVTPGDKRSRVTVAVDNDHLPITKQGTSVTHTTLIGCICADGTAVPSSYVVDRDTYNIKEIDKQNLSYIKVWSAKSGWINTHVLYSWIQDIFLPYVNKKRKDMNLDSTNDYCLLILDAHTTRNDTDFLRLCENNRIDVIVLPKNTTSVFQPLDLVIYNVYKSKFRRYYKTTNRYSLLAASEDAFSEAFTRRNILSAWQASRLLIDDENEFIKDFDDRPRSKVTRKSSKVSNKILTNINREMMEDEFSDKLDNTVSEDEIIVNE
ncbi:hypothetical protein WA158_001337 [Blastocystis sp. Blastoise]